MIAEQNLGRKMGPKTFCFKMGGGKSHKIFLLMRVKIQERRKICIRWTRSTAGE